MSNPSTGSYTVPAFSWSREILASIVVLLVALPLCMGIAIASGVPPALGLISGVIGGIVVSTFGGCRFQVSGPAAGLVVLVHELVGTWGIAALGVAGISVGIIQFVSARLGLGRYFRATSPAVIEGMLAGIGVLIFAGQFHVMIDDRPRSGGLANIMALPEAISKALTPVDGTVHHLAALVGITTIVSLVLWEKFKPKALAFFPGALVGVLAGTALAQILRLPLAQVNAPQSLFAELNIPTAESFTLLTDGNFVTAVIILAVIASAESLLSANAVDKMRPETRTNYDRELQAQGIGNLVTGIFGALPLTGVIVRSSANVNAGAQSNLSGIMHGVWLALVLILIPSTLSYIPTSALGAILVFTGYRLANPAHIKHFWNVSRWELFIFLTTMALVVVEDILIGVLAGLFLTAGRLFLRLSALHIDVSPKPEHLHVLLRGSATFVSLPTLADALEDLPQAPHIVVDVRGLGFVDHACLELLEGWEKKMKNRGVTVELDLPLLRARFKEPAMQGVLASLQGIPKKIIKAEIQ